MSDLQLINRWYPERFFLSHASADKDLTIGFQQGIERLNEGYEVYVAERVLVGRPLIEKLREEMLNSNAMIVAWSKKSSEKSREIISFELGMAYSLQLPIYLFRFDNAELPWFFDKLTDYAICETTSTDEIFRNLKKMEPMSFLHPVDVKIPKENYDKYGRGQPSSSNWEVVQDDGSLSLKPGFKGTIHFRIENRRNKPEKNLRVYLVFPPAFQLSFNAGSIDCSSGIQRTEFFEMVPIARNIVLIYWPTLPLEQRNLEIGLQLDSAVTSIDPLICSASSDNILGLRAKLIKINLLS